jgi:hypothetical protein
MIAPEAGNPESFEGREITPIEDGASYVDREIRLASTAFGLSAYAYQALHISRSNVRLVPITDQHIDTSAKVPVFPHGEFSRFFPLSRR